MGGGSDDRDARTTRKVGASQDPPSDLLEPGARVGDYRIVDRIAVGGFGAVYRAEHADGRPAALKLLHRELASSREAVLRFEREVSAVKVIRHPNVVDIFELGYHDGKPYFAMELLTGQDLYARIAERGRLSIAETMAILEPLCSALVAAHAGGIIHRDIKASNVFLHGGEGGPRVVLLDFGVAKLLDVDGSALTTSHHAIGTPACMAPEQIVGGEITTRTDVYGLGVLAYHMLTGQLPFAGSGVTMMQHMHLDAERPRPSAIVPSTSPADAVVVKAMSRKAAGRHPSISAFLDDMRAAATPVRESTEVSSTEPALGVHVAILVAPELLEAPDERLLADLDAINMLITDTLEARGFGKLLDTVTTALLVRRREPARSETDDLRDARATLESLLRSLDDRPERDDRLSISIVVRSASVLVTGGAIDGGQLLDLAAWLPAELAPGLRVLD